MENEKTRKNDIKMRGRGRVKLKKRMQRMNNVKIYMKKKCNFKKNLIRKTFKMAENV